MKAYQLHAVDDLRYEDVNIPVCPDGWCIVKVKAAGICSSDIPRIYKKGTYHFPTIPGHEFSGVVEKTANPNDYNLVGKRVGIFPLIPCKQCDCCKQGKYELCKNYDYLGSRRNGGFAEYVAVPVWNLVELDDKVSFVDAALMEPLAVSLHAIKQMELKETDHVAIVGTGMIAFAAAQWAVCKNVRSVSVIGRSENKKVIAESIPGIIYKTYDHVEQEYDVVLEAVGSNDAIDRSINMIKPGGILVLMGNPEGDIYLKQDTYWRILRKQLVLKGTWNSSYEKDKLCDWSEVKNALNNHSLSLECLISHVFLQKELKKALKIMQEHKEPYCKIMTLWNEEELEK